MSVNTPTTLLAQARFLTPTHYSFDTVIHFAALKAVGESVREPLLYYSNNIQVRTPAVEVTYG